MKNTEKNDTWMLVSDTIDALEVMDDNVRLAYEEGSPFELPLRNVRPELLIHSLRPLRFEYFGVVLHRAPRLIGKYALRELLWEKELGAAFVWAIVEDESKVYGVPAGPPILNSLCKALDLKPGWMVDI